jgi:CYTH domain-containing protein
MAPEENAICFEDRPVVDGNGYVPDPEFSQLLKSRGLSREEVYKWYAGIVFLRTAAKGAEKFYTTANNAARTEGVELARKLDSLTERAYVGFPRQFHIIGNETDFEGKIRRAQQAVSHIAGLPVPTEIQRKFLLGSGALASVHAEVEHTRTVKIEQMYLDAPAGQEIRIRRRTDGSDSSFYESWKEDTSGIGVRLRREIAIDHDTYARLAESAVSVLRKERTAFVYEDQYYWLDQVTHPEELTVLEVELTEENRVVRLPDWLGPAREVTAEPYYRMANIAARGVGGPQLV